MKKKEVTILLAYVSSNFYRNKDFETVNIVNMQTVLQFPDEMILT